MRIFNRSNKVIEEYARVIDWTPLWDTGAPMPQVFSNGHKTFLIYLINDPDPNWDGSYVTMIDNTSDTTYFLALVEFNGHTLRFGIANEEVFCGLKLWDKGLKEYSAHIIENSSWISELKTINRVHPYYNEDRWADKKHFLLLFHDEILEVIATGYKIETVRSTFEQMAIKVAKLLNSL